MTDAHKALDSAESLILEFFDSNEAIKNQFQQSISAVLLQFAEALVPAFKRFPSFAEECGHNVQTGLVGAFIHGVLDDLVVSVKLLVMGKLGPSGNAYRQALEGVCMAAMCAYAGTLLVGDKEQHYWQLVVDDDKAARGDLAVRQFLKNAERLGLNADGAKQLQEALAAHHDHSHAGRLALANRMELGPAGLIYFGGHFDPAKTEAYCLEMQQRIIGAKWLVELLDALTPQVKALVASTPPTVKPQVD